MKKALILSLVAVFTLLGTAQAQSVIKPIDFADKIENTENAILLDVRTPKEWNEGIIEGAMLLNFFSPAFEAEIAKLDKEKTILVYCRSGGRSGKTATKLHELGFKEIYDLEGGMNAWNEKKYPTVSP